MRPATTYGSVQVGGMRQFSSPFLAIDEDPACEAEDVILAGPEGLAYTGVWRGWEPVLKGTGLRPSRHGGYTNGVHPSLVFGFSPQRDYASVHLSDTVVRRRTPRQVDRPSYHALRRLTGQDHPNGQVQVMMLAAQDIARQVFDERGVPYVSLRTSRGTKISGVSGEGMVPVTSPLRDEASRINMVQLLSVLGVHEPLSRDFLETYAASANRNRYTTAVKDREIWQVWRDLAPEIGEVWDVIDNPRQYRPHRWTLQELTGRFAISHEDAHRLTQLSLAERERLTPEYARERCHHLAHQVEALAEVLGEPSPSRRVA